MSTYLRLSLRQGLFLAAALTAAGQGRAHVSLHPIFADNMVLQREKPVRIWGRAASDEAVAVEFAGQSAKTTAAADGSWEVTLGSLEASREPRVLRVRGASNEARCSNVLVGDLWLLGGQSNMEDPIHYIYEGDTEVASAHHGAIRLMTIPVLATPEPKAEFTPLDEYNGWTRQSEKKGWWFVCSPQTVRLFSAIGYVFGRRLYLASEVPIGLVDASVGGTTVEAWTSRAALAKIPEAAPLLSQWDAKIAAYDPEKDLQDRIARWERDSAKRKAEGRPLAEKPTDLRPGPAFDRNDPGASYNGMIAPLAGLAIKGAIFNQGYNNALGDARPALYAKSLRAMILDWRRTFRDEHMPFGIVELTAGGQPQTIENFELMAIDPAPFIREAQLAAYRELKQVGYACAYDQQVPWYHPHKKMRLAERMARWALDTQYGVRLGWKPALCVKTEQRGHSLALSFDRVVQTHDGRPVEGFAVAGPDGVFRPAEARYAVVGKDDRGRDRLDRRTLEVWSDLVESPATARYAWARNPLGNLVSGEHHERIIAVPSFRTDHDDWPEAGFGPEARGENGRRRHEMRERAKRQNRERRLEEARRRLQKLEAEADEK